MRRGSSGHRRKQGRCLMAPILRLSAHSTEGLTPSGYFPTCPAWGPHHPLWYPNTLILCLEVSPLYVPTSDQLFACTVLYPRNTRLLLYTCLTPCTSFRYQFRRLPWPPSRPKSHHDSPLELSTPLLRCT